MKNRIIQLLGGVPRSDYKSVQALYSNTLIGKGLVENHVERLTKDLRTARIALAAVAACETPNSNGTVRKMARMAREALR